MLQVLGICILLTPAVLADTTYEVEPYQLSDGYSITGGFITTDDTIGNLTTANILDFQFVVTGEFPYTLAPSNSGHQISIAGAMEATNISIIIPPSSPFLDNQLLILAEDNTPPECVDCEQGLSFTTRDANLGIALYTHQDDHDFLPFEFGQRIFLPNAPIVLATVPEPAGVLILLQAVSVAALVWGSISRSKRSPRD